MLNYFKRISNVFCLSDLVNKLIKNICVVFSAILIFILDDRKLIVHPCFTLECLSRENVTKRRLRNAYLYSLIKLKDSQKLWNDLRTLNLWWYVNIFFYFRARISYSRISLFLTTHFARGCFQTFSEVSLKFKNAVI